MSTTSNTPNNNNKRVLENQNNNDEHAKKKIKKRRPGPLTIAEENFISNAFKSVKNQDNLSTDLKRMRRKFIVRETQRNSNLLNFNIDDKIHNYLVHTKKKDQKLSFYYHRDDIPCFQAKHLLNIQSIFHNTPNQPQQQNIVQPQHQNTVSQQYLQSSTLKNSAPTIYSTPTITTTSNIHSTGSNSYMGPQLTKLPNNLPPPLPQTTLQTKLYPSPTTTTTTTTSTNKPLSPIQNYSKLYPKPISAPLSPSSKLSSPLPNKPINTPPNTTSSTISSINTKLIPPTIPNTNNNKSLLPNTPPPVKQPPVNIVNNNNNNNNISTNQSNVKETPSNIENVSNTSTPTSTNNGTSASIPVPMVVSKTTATPTPKAPKPTSSKKKVDSKNKKNTNSTTTTTSSKANNNNTIEKQNNLPVTIGIYPNLTVVHPPTINIDIKPNVFNKNPNNSSNNNNLSNNNKKNESLFKYYHWKNQTPQTQLNKSTGTAVPQTIITETFKKPFEILSNKILGRESVNSYISPYTTRELKPFIRRDFQTVPRKLQVIRELYQFFILNNINKDLDEIDEENSKTLTSKSLFKQLKHSVDYRYLTPDLADRVRIFLCENFWNGITIDDIMGYPDFTVCAMYKSMVIGCGIMNPDGYIMFISVHPEWQGYGIASFMLYHLTQTMIGKDITLHVSVNNPAMILYQQFAFKAEEYIQNFYENYYSDDSGKSKDAYLLRLRR